MDTKENRELALKKAQETAPFNTVEWDDNWNRWDIYIAYHTTKNLYTANIPYVIMVKDGIAKKPNLDEIDNDWFEKQISANPLYTPKTFS